MIDCTHPGMYKDGPLWCCIICDTPIHRGREVTTFYVVEVKNTICIELVDYHLYRVTDLGMEPMADRRIGDFKKLWVAKLVSWLARKGWA